MSINSNLESFINYQGSYGRGVTDWIIIFNGRWFRHCSDLKHAVFYHKQDAMRYMTTLIEKGLRLRCRQYHIKINNKKLKKEAIAIHDALVNENKIMYKRLLSYNDMTVNSPDVIPV